jgi:hypothetical protein
MEGPILATMNTFDTTEHPCVEETSGSLCTVESIPALRTGFSEDLSKRTPRSEKGGEMDTRHSTTSTRNADKRKDQSKASGGVKPKDTIKSKPSCRKLRLDNKEGSQELIESTTSEENKVQESIQMNGDTPVAFRTRRCRQQIDSTKIEGDEEDLGQDTNRHKDK